MKYFPFIYDKDFNRSFDHDFFKCAFKSTITTRFEIPFQIDLVPKLTRLEKMFKVPNFLKDFFNNVFRREMGQWLIHTI